MSEWLLGAQLKARSVVCIRQAFFACCLVVQLCPTLCTPWTAARQAPLSIGFPRQEYWSGLPFPSPGDLPDPGIEPGSPALQAGSLPLEPPKKPMFQGRRHFPKTLLTRLRTADPASLCLKGPFRCVRCNKQGRLPASSGIPCWSPLS